MKKPPKIRNDSRKHKTAGTLSHQTGSPKELKISIYPTIYPLKNKIYPLKNKLHNL